MPKATKAKREEPHAAGAASSRLVVATKLPRWFDWLDLQRTLGLEPSAPVCTTSNNFAPTDYGPPTIEQVECGSLNARHWKGS